MSEKNRIFGNNIRVMMKRKRIRPEQLAKRLGYSTQEIHRIIDARLFLTTEEKKEIAKALGTTVSLLHQALDDKTYKDAGGLEYEGEFSKPEHKKKILDLFDTYCDTQEILAEEGLKEISMKPNA